MRHATFLTLLWILAFPAPGLTCCTGEPYPGLWDAIDDAKAIAIVHVDAVRPRDTYSFSKLYHDGLELASGAGVDWLSSVAHHLPDPDWTPTYRAKVQVLDVLKGSMAAGEKTSLHSTWSCSEGGFFVPGRTLIAFLHKRSGGWHPLPWYDSTVYLERPADLAELARVIRNGDHLQSKGLVTPAEQRAWARDAVRTVGRQWLTWEDLEMLRDEEIVRAFVEVPTLDLFNLKILERLAEVESPEVDLQAMRILEAWLSTPGSWNFSAPKLLLHIESRMHHPMTQVSEMSLLTSDETPERWRALRQLLGSIDLDASQAIAKQASFSAWQGALHGDALAAHK